MGVIMRRLLLILIYNEAIHVAIEKLKPASMDAGFIFSYLVSMLASADVLYPKNALIESI